MTIRETVRVSGPDAASYLQGQISQDVDSLPVGQTSWSLVLDPAGKVSAWFRVHRSAGDEFLLDIDTGYRSVLIERLERFKLRVQAEIEATDDMIPEPLRWPGADDPTDERQRILAGMPKMGAELTPDTIPGEGGQRFIDESVSFTKGCYTGQELVARIDSRGGNVPRPVRVLQGVSDLTLGAEVVHGGEVVGQITSASGDAALAPLKRSVEVGADVTVDGTAARIIEPAPG